LSSGHSDAMAPPFPEPTCLLAGARARSSSGPAGDVRRLAKLLREPEDSPAVPSEGAVGSLPISTWESNDWAVGHVQ